MKYFLIAGEASGDMHAAGLIRELRKRDPHPIFIGLGGDAMAAEGCTLYLHYRNMAYMGYVDVLKHLPDIYTNIRTTKHALLQENPDEIVLIDYPGFNLRIARFCKQHLRNASITYYIPPKVWAWKKWRTRQIGRYTDRIIGIFPFEPSFYAHYGYTCTYAGNPVVETIDTWLASHQTKQQPQAHYIALLPGSRRHEIEQCLPKMLEAATHIAGRHKDIAHIVIAMAPGLDETFYAPFIHNHSSVTLTRETYATVRYATAAVVNSGTATLETALLGCPQVAVYHLACGRLLALLKPIMFSIPHFTLVNIIAGKEVIKELLAHEFTVAAVENELSHLLTDANYRATMCDEYARMRTLLGQKRAAASAAEQIYKHKQH